MYRVVLACVLSVSGLVAQAPTVAPLSPGSGQGSEANLTLTVSVPNGIENLADVRLMIQNEINGEKACYLSHDPSTGELFLRTDDDSAWGVPLPIGGPFSDYNNQCSVSAAGASIGGTATEYTLRVHLHFTSRFSGLRRIWAQAINRQGLGSSRWTTVGEWVVPEDVRLPRRIERFRLGEASDPVFVSTAPDPNVEVRVYRNGLLLAPDDDYTMSAQWVSFVNAVSAGDLIQVDFSPKCSLD